MSLPNQAELGALGGHRRTERREPTLQPGLCGPGGNVEDVGDIGQWQVEVEVEDHDRALIDGQPPELAAEPISLHHVRREVDLGREAILVGHEVDLGQVPAPVRPSQPITGADGEPVQPGVPCLGIAKSANVAPGQHERLLDRVLGAIRIPEDELGGAMQTASRRTHQLGECLVIAVPGSLHELDLHLVTAAGATEVAALTQYESPQGANGSLA